MTRHPEAREEGDGKLEHESGNMRRESDETEVKHLGMKHIVVKYIIQYPFQNQVHSSTGSVTEQFEAHHLAERRIEKVDDRGHSAFCPGFYVAEG